MRVAVCCPGPSLPRTWRGRDGFDLVYAVNRALLIVGDADWLSAGDITTIEDHLPVVARPRIGVITFDSHLDRVASHPSWSAHQVVGWQSVSLIREHELHGRPLAWSVQAALCHAAELGAREVHLFGADMSPTGPRTDCTGFDGENRTPQRWEREAIDLALTQRLLAARGVSLNRILPT